MTTVCVSLVTYNSGSVIGDCLRSIPPDVPVYVADNGSTDQTLDVVRQVRPDAHIKKLRNIGFGRAHNVNIRNSDSDFVLVLNPDTILLPDCLAVLLDTAHGHPDAGLVGALHQQPDGALNACFKNDRDYYPQLIRCAAAKSSSRAIVPDGPLCVEQITGALMLIRRQALQAVTGFSERLFMYFEDDDLCARIRKAGYAVIVAPQARVIHLEGKSSATSGASHKVACIKGYHFERSRKVVHVLYHGRNAAYYQLILSGVVRCLRRAVRYRLKNDPGRAVYYMAGIKGLLSPLPARLSQ